MTRTLLGPEASDLFHLEFAFFGNVVAGGRQWSFNHILGQPIIANITQFKHAGILRGGERTRRGDAPVLLKRLAIICGPREEIDASYSRLRCLLFPVLDERYLC